MTEPANSGDGIVQVAYLHPEEVSHSWVDSMRRMWEYDLNKGGLRIARKPLNLKTGSGRLVPNRNFATRLFLERTPHEWMLFVDTDMGFPDDAVHRLLAAADPVDRPVIGGLCFAQMEATYDGAGGHRHVVVPTMYAIGDTDEGEPSFCYFGDYEDDTLTRVAGTGAAFLLMHRTVLEKMRAQFGDHWWDQFYDGKGDMTGEDLAFCARLGKMGVPIFVHTGVKTTHHKHLWLSEEDYQIQRAVTISLETALPPAVDLGASLATLVDDAHVQGNGAMLKLPEDLARYQSIIETTRPEVIVETGTWTGASAAWFSVFGVDVITVDINHDRLVHRDRIDGEGVIWFYRGSSVDPDIVAQVRERVAGRRCMVVLDSDHSAAHVAQEIDLYGPMVTPGCYLVVEDTIFGHAPQPLRDRHIGGQKGSPLEPVASMLAGNPAWSRDMAVERMSPVSHHPGGWWVRNA